jgi:hypothetical protein
MPNYTLAHPLYLDVPMMISFLAHLEGGVSFEDEETLRSGRTREAKGEGSGKFRFGLLGPLLGMDAGVAASASGKSEETAEYKAARHHTVASLFNALYGYLHEDETIVRIKEPDQRSSLQLGELVELTGRYIGNPLEDILDFFGQLLPYMEDAESATTQERRPSPKKSGNPAVRAKAAEADADATVKAALEQVQREEQEFGIRMIQKMREDIAKSPVHDVMLETSSGIRAVLTVSSQYYSPTTNEYLRAGGFGVLGKVTRVLSGEETINLTRRTVLGVAGPELSREIVNGMTRGPDFHIESTDPIVSAPAVQVLPMAIFI